MSNKLPYVVEPNKIEKVLRKIKEAKVPERFTQDFLDTVLNCKGGNYRQFVPLAKKLSILNSDGTPTELYKKFRNNATSSFAMAQALKVGYAEVFDRNEYANKLSKEDFKGLVVEITGLEPKNRVVKLICSTFETLKKLADFEQTLPEEESSKELSDSTKGTQGAQEEIRDFDLNLSYTINLVLPKTDDPAVFNAIFRSLREHLLRK